VWTNYKRKSGESLSLVFLYIWLAGDTMNLIGATLDNLLLTMRLMAWYYIFADLVLISQIYYYRRTSVKASFESVITHANPELLNTHEHHHGEHAPFVGAGSTANYSSIPSSKHVHTNEHDRIIHKAAMAANATAVNYSGVHHASSSDPEAERPVSHQRRHSAHSSLSTNSAKYRSIRAKRRKMIRKVVFIIFSLVVLAVFIWICHDWLQCANHEDSEESDRCGRGHHGGRGEFPPSPSRPPMGVDDLLAMINGRKELQNQPGGGDHEDKSGFHVGLAWIFGWGSAVLYLGSRVPQIYKNWKLKSCEGLAMMMFVFSVLGNITYVASILIFSLDIDYLIKNMPWCIGSGGTLFFDFTIFFQFYAYRSNAPLNEAFQEAAATGELNKDTLVAAADSESIEDDLDSESSSHSSRQQSKSKKVDKSQTQHQPETSISTNV
ncbi:hypothetical protein BGZ65_005515, partial [Modicella reniformis]